MASSYTTSFGIEKIGSGEQSGAWGDTTNHNIDILDRIASYKAVGLSGTTHTLTVREASPGSGTENLQDGMYRVIKFTGALGGNNTVTVAPNTAAAFFIIINATTDSGSSGPYSVILTQGSGANITVTNGKSAVVYVDGAGSGAAVVDAVSNLALATVTTSGTITSGGTVAVTGNVTATGTVEPAGDTAASDNAAIGYTSAEGLILTGQGSTNDVTIKNDADADVITIATGATNVDIVGDVTASTVNADGDTAAADNAAMGYTAAEGLILTGQGSTNDVTIKNDADADVIKIPTGTTNVTIVGNLTTATGGIATASLADNAVTLAKMAGGTDGNIISYDASGDPVAVATGTDGQVLTSSGAGAVCAFEDATGGGKILQVIEASTTTQVSTTSTSYVDTGLTGTITPAGTGSKILVLCSVSLMSNGGAAVAECKIVRTISTTATDKYVYSGISHVDAQSGNHFLSVLDSPSTTSACVYKVQAFLTDQSGTLMFQRNDGSDLGRSTITLLEVGA
jgi:hypothetical protein